MNTLKSVCLLVFISTILTFCSDSTSVNLINKNFEDEVPIAGNLIFSFDKDVVPDFLVGKWDTTKYIKFQPEIRGRFKWQTKSELVFSPIHYLLPSTKYTADFVEENFPVEIESDIDEFSFHTPFLRIDEVKSYWALSPDKNNIYAFFDLNFNYEVKPREIIQLLTLEVDGAKKQCKLLSETQSKTITVYAADIQMKDEDIPAKIIIEEGAKTAVENIQTKEPIETETMIPSPYRFTIEDVTAEHDGVVGTVTVYTSQGVKEGELRKYITINPSVKYDIEVGEQSFIIKSEDFDADKSYDLTLEKGMKGILHGELKHEFNQQLVFGELDPNISFINKKGMYLCDKGSKNVEINIVNVPEVDVKIYKVYQNNIISYLGKNYYSHHYYDNDDYYNSYYYGYDYTSAPGSLGDVVWEKKYNTKDLPKKGNCRLLNLDFEDKIGGYNGLYVVEVKSQEDYWLRSRKIVSISDIGLIAKEGKNTITVFANSVKNAEALSNVTLTFIGKNNQIVGEAKTDGNGVAVFKTGELPASGFELSLIAAEMNGDFNFLPFSRTKISTSRFDIGGRVENESGFDAFIYGERDIYRLGETINITTIIRDNEWKVPGKIPVKLKFITPSGKEYRTIRKTLNEAGSFETSITLPESAMTGTYSAEVYTSNDVLLNSKSIAIEEFMPDRIKVDIELNKEELRPGDKARLNIRALNFFGPPAADRNYSVEMSLKRKGFSARNYRSYNFHIQGTETYFSTKEREGKTDNNGEARETFEIPKNYEHMGILLADFYVTVFDETGRPVHRRKKVDVYTQEVFYGIDLRRYYNSTGQQMKIPLIAVDKNGMALNNVKASVTLIKHEYKTVLTKSGSYFRYRSEHEEKILEQKTMTLNGATSYFAFTPKLSGKYEIKISAPGVNSFVSNTFYAYGYGATTAGSFKVNNEGNIDIELDKDSYKVGDDAKVILKTPFSGKILVTVESNKVIDHFYIESDKRAASFEIPIRKEFVPNVYVTATLFRKHKSYDLPLTVAHGFKPLLVENPSTKLPVKIIAKEKSNSRMKQNIKIESEPNSHVTIAVVDEGILQLTGYKTPAPHDFFYRKRALEVTSYDVYPYLLPEIELRRSATGGGDDFMSKRVNPLTNRRVKLVSFWSGIVKTDSNGEANYEIQIPQFSGDLRIMAVAYKGDAFGSNHDNMKVADPIVISAAIPRFLSPKDTVDIPVTITNTTSKSERCKVEIQTSGPLDIISDRKDKISISANRENRVKFRVAAKAQIGEAKINIVVEGMGKNFLHETDITVRPASPLQKMNGWGTVDAGNSKTVNMDVNQFIPSSIDNKLVVSNTPLIHFSDDLEYLLRYPYGCVEQTVSSVFPQLYYQDLVKSILNRADDNADPVNNIQAAIKRLKLMQLYNGGLTFWPGHGSESWWGSVYAAHFLVEAKKAGYEVDNDFLDKLLDYLKMKLKSKKTFTYYYNRNKKKEIAPKEVPYSLYVLALADEKQSSTMNYYKSRPDLLSLDGKYLLAAAYALTGDKLKYKQILPPAFEGEKAEKVTGGSFYSYVRDEAIALNALLEVEPDNQQIGIMAKHLSEQLKSRRYLNTQERSFGFLALGKVARQSARNNVSANIISNNKTVGQFRNHTLNLTTGQLQGTKIKIDAKGEGELYYFWEAEGISADGSYRQEDSFLKVRKQFFDRWGNRSTDLTFEQNDLVVVKITIQALVDDYIKNVVISDILPAGFEIENPRISELPGINWIKDKSYPTHQDIRDDRINLFVNVSAKARNYYYVVRAVSPGIFQMGPVGADAMYDGEYHSYHGAGVVRIREK